MAFCTGACSCDAICGRRTVSNTATTAWKRAVAYSRAEWSSAACCIWERSTTGEQAAWRKTLDVFDERQQRATTLSLFPEDRPAPADALDTIQVKLSQMQLRRARPYGNCWLGCELWRQLELDRFWERKLPRGREEVGWSQVLELLVVNRLIDPGSEFRVHRQWARSKRHGCTAGG